MALRVPPNCSSVSLGIMSPKWGRPLLMAEREERREWRDRPHSMVGTGPGGQGKKQLKKTPDLLLEPLFLISPASLLLLLSPQGLGWKDHKVLHSREENSALRPRAQVMRRMRRMEMAAMETFILLAGGRPLSSWWGAAAGGELTWWGLRRLLG